MLYISTLCLFLSYKHRFLIGVMKIEILFYFHMYVAFSLEGITKFSWVI